MVLSGIHPVTARVVAVLPPQLRDDDYFALGLQDGIYLGGGTVLLALLLDLVSYQFVLKMVKTDTSKRDLYLRAVAANCFNHLLVGPFTYALALTIVGRIPSSFADWARSSFPTGSYTPPFAGWSPATAIPNSRCVAPLLSAPAAIVSTVRTSTTIAGFPTLLATGATDYARGCRDEVAGICGAHKFSPLRFFGVLLVQAIGYFQAHKTMHKKENYWMHRFHHQYVPPNVVPMSASAVSVAEYAFAYMLPIVAAILVCLPDRYALFLAVAAISFANLLIHTPGLEDAMGRVEKLFGCNCLSRYLVSTAAHLEHHTSLNCHFAAPILNLDWICANWCKGCCSGSSSAGKGGGSGSSLERADNSTQSAGSGGGGGIKRFSILGAKPSGAGDGSGTGGGGEKDAGSGKNGGKAKNGGEAQETTPRKKRGVLSGMFRRKKDSPR